MISNNDIHYMRHALSLAGRGIGRTAPNPSVGCVIVSNETVVGRGWTADGGRPHAETQAISMAGPQVSGATVYVTLEPCAHKGETGSCAKALVAASPARVVIACGDPDERVSGRGVEILEQAGIEVEFGVLERESQRLNAGFFLRVTENRPFVTLKIATSTDQKIAAAAGVKTQITGVQAGRYTHLMRSQHDAILVGANTARIDQPQLTTRIDGYQHVPKRFVLGDAVIAGLDPITGVDTHDIKAVLGYLAGQGVTRLLVEGGAQVHTAFLKSGFCDQFIWLKSPDMIGEQGAHALVGYDLMDLEADFGLKVQKTQVLGQDLLAIYERSP